MMKRGAKIRPKRLFAGHVLLQEAAAARGLLPGEPYDERLQVLQGRGAGRGHASVLRREGQALRGGQAAQKL